MLTLFLAPSMTRVPSTSPSRPAKTIVVTGATGRIGSAVVDRLLARGDRVIALDRVENKRLPDSPGLLGVIGDCTVEADVERAFDLAQDVGGVDGVVHLAALPHMSAGTPIDVFGTNVVATFTVLAVAARQHVSPAVIASSIHATGLLGHHAGPLPDAFPLDEQQAAHLDDWYSLSKHVDEDTAAMVASRWGIAVLALRFPLVQSSADLERTAQSYRADPARAVREGWSYLEDIEAARAVTCALDSQSTGAHVLQLAAPDSLLDSETEALLDRYAPGVPHRRPMPGRAAPVDTSRAADLIGFIARSRFDAVGAGSEQTRPLDHQETAG